MTQTKRVVPGQSQHMRPKSAEAPRLPKPPATTSNTPRIEPSWNVIHLVLILSSSLAVSSLSCVLIYFFRPALRGPPDSSVCFTYLAVDPVNDCMISHLADVMSRLFLLFASLLFFFFQTKNKISLICIHLVAITVLKQPNNSNGKK